MEKTDSEDPDDPSKVEDGNEILFSSRYHTFWFFSWFLEINKKVKTENSLSYERVTRSKAVSAKKEEVGERLNEIKEDGVISEPSLRIIENKEVSVEKPKEEPPKQSQEKKIIMTRLTENKNVCVPEKQNVSSSVSISLANEKKAENLATSKKKIPPNPSHKKKIDDHQVGAKSKFVKRALVSSKVKPQNEIRKKSMNDNIGPYFLIYMLCYFSIIFMIIINVLSILIIIYMNIYII